MVDDEQQDDIVDVHAENTPQILKDHDRWLLWDSSNDTPRRPHWTGDFSIDYNDPANWHTFEEALEAAESNPSWGIGFVTTDTPITVIDLDGCRRTTGHFDDDWFQFKWWVPDAFPEEIAENYKEFSPSKTGVHLPVIGFDIPDWWSDKSFEDAEHEGVDVLDNKFCTVTGMGDGEKPVMDVTDGDDQWLRNALADMYETITGEDPRSGPDTPSGDGYSPGDEWLQPADVQDALTYIDADVGYPEWRNIGFAVAEYFRRVVDKLDDDGFDVALETFEEWSQDGEKWDREAEQNAFNIIKAGFEGDDDHESHVTIGTLLHVAERNGWDMPDKTIRLTQQTVESFMEKFDAVEDRDDDDDDPNEAWLKNLADAVAALDEETYGNCVDEIVARINYSRGTVERHRDLAADHEYGDLVNLDGRLCRVDGSPWLSTSSVLSFEFDVDSILDLPDENGRSSIVQIDPPAESEPAFDLDVPPKVFNDVRRFKDEILSRVYSTTIEDNRSHSAVLDDIRHWIAEQDVPTRVAQYEMGLNDDGTEFVTPAGSITPGGWTDTPDSVHIERGSKSNATVRSFEANPDEHDDIDTDAVAEMIELIAQSRLQDRLTAILGWFYAAPHRQRIFDASATFNPLAVVGRSGAGKTATLATLNQMWGMGTEPQSVDSTKHAVLTGFAASRGVPVWFDEYRPEKSADYAIDRFHGYYKKSATGGIVPKGNHSMGTDDWHLRSPVVVSGESEIRSNAERRRTVNVTVTDTPTEDAEMQRAFKFLVGNVTKDDDGALQFPDRDDLYDLQKHAVAYYSWVADMDEDEFRDAWFDARKRVAEFLDAYEDLDLGDTEIQALQTVTFGHQQMIVFANAMGADLSVLPGEDALEDALAHVADVDGDGRQPHEHEFFSLAARAASAGYLEADTDYRVVHEGEPNEELRVNVTRAFDKISKFARDHDLNVDLLQSAQDYKSRFGQMETNDTYVQTTSQNTPPISRCTGIDMSRAVDDVAGFSRGSFVDVDVEDEGGNGGPVNDDSDDGDDGPTPLKNVRTDDDFVTVTADVVDWDTMPEEVRSKGGPIESGSVVDVTGRRKVVVFDYDGDTKPDGIGNMGSGETVRIKNAEVNEYNGAPQLTLDSGTTITPVQQGVGHTDGEDPGEGQATIDDADEPINDDGTDTTGDATNTPTVDGDESAEDAVRADGGSDEDDGQGLSQDARAKALQDSIDTHNDGGGAPVDAVIEDAVDAGADRILAEQMLKKWRTQGRSFQPSEGRVKYVGGD